MVNETSDRPKLTAKGARTRARIVEEAAALIHERGVAGTTLEDVKVAAEVSGSQIYHYFPDKNELVQAVIDYQAETHRQAPSEGARQCDLRAERPRATHSRTPRVSSEHQRTQPSITARGEVTRTRIITTASRVLAIVALIGLFFSRGIPAEQPGSKAKEPTSEGELHASTTAT